MEFIKWIFISLFVAAVVVQTTYDYKCTKKYGPNAVYSLGSGVCHAKPKIENIEVLGPIP